MKSIPLKFSRRLRLLANGWWDLLLRPALLVAFAITLGVPAAADEPILGEWLTKSGRVAIAKCGEAVCAYVVASPILDANPDQRDVHNPDPALRDRPIRGLQVLWGFIGGPHEWAGGTAYNPETGDVSDSATLNLLEDGTLRVEGCIFLFCRTQTWHRP